MDTRTERDTEIRTEHPEAQNPKVYEAPMLDEIGEFTVLTRANNGGRYADRFGYYYE
jgi:hypothetical protein